jgi:hypothetical protein
MDFNFIIKRALAIFTKPKDEWEVIKNENMSVKDLFLKYAIILAAIPAVAGLIGYTLIGISFGYGTFRMPFARGLTWAIFTYVLSLGGAFLLGFIIDTLAPSFGAKKDLNQSMKVVIFAYTATWLGGVFYLIPSLSILGALIGIYTLVLLYMGMKRIKEVPQEKMVGYYVVTLIVSIAVYIVMGLIVGAVAFGSAAAAYKF